MPGIVIVGVQWGDEGKGKATDLLGERTDWVVKFNGGNNAGHTVVIGDEKYALHLLPSGILSPGVNAVIGNGVVIDLEVLFAELGALQARGLDVSRLKVSASAHIITQYHRTLDKVTERFLGKKMIGTTGRVLTKLDILTGLKEIPVCVAYDVDGERFDEVPVNQTDFHHATPILENFPGWDEDISTARTFEDLPQTAQDYVLTLEKMSGTRISVIGVGAARDAVIVRHDLLD